MHFMFDVWGNINLTYFSPSNKLILACSESRFYLGFCEWLSSNRDRAPISLVGSGGMPSPRTFCKIKAFLVRFPGFSADVSIGLNDNASFT